MLYNHIQSHSRSSVRYVIRIADNSSRKMSLVESKTTERLINHLKKNGISSSANCKSALLYTGRSCENLEYEKCIEDLNSLQSNRRILSRDASYMFNLFKKQLSLSGLDYKKLNKLKVIHITGTKGKGSTCAFTESILRASGLKTGLYSSPHLVEVNERIKINGSPISNVKFSKLFRPIYDKLLIETERNDLPMPGYFAFLTIMAFDTFVKEEVDCLVLEVGIGGQYDSTNVIESPVVCGISTLDYDHTNILGDTIEQIAWTKSGIVKKGVPLFTVEQPDAPEAERVISKRCVENETSIHICYPIDKNSIRLGIQGDAQYTNAALACQLSRYFLSKNLPTLSISMDKTLDTRLQTDLNDLPSFFSQALMDCFLPGRCQIFKDGSKSYFIDGAHTRKSMENCMKWFQDHSKGSSDKLLQILIINIIGERDKISLIKPLIEYGKFDEVIFTSNKLMSLKSQDDKNQNVTNSHTLGETMDNAYLNLEAWTSLELHKSQASKTKYSIHANISESLAYIDNTMSRKSENDVHILVTGSLALAGSVLKMLDYRNKV